MGERLLPEGPAPGERCNSFVLRPDGLRRGPRCDAVLKPWVLVLEGRVLHAGPESPDGWPEGLPAFSGGWLLEPLADAHVHLFLSGSSDAGERKRVSGLGPEEALARALGLLAACRAQGIAAVRDGGDPRGVALEAAKVANARPEEYAAVLPAGEPVYRKGSYGSFLGRGAASCEEGIALLERNRRRGATHAKVLATGLNSLERAGEVEPGGFSAAELSTILAGAADLGLPAMIHANGSLGAMALPGRGSTLEHGFWLESSDLAVLARSGCAWTPTLGAWAELASLPGLSSARRAVVAATDQRQRNQVKIAAAAGVALLAGSDAGTPGVEHGSGLLRELGRLRDAGLEPARALASSSHAARQLCERELGRPLGALEPGGAAGFLWFADDPVACPEVLSAPAGVFLGGRLSRPQHAAARKPRLEGGRAAGRGSAGRGTRSG